MVDRQSSGRFSKQVSCRGSCSPASEDDEDRLLLETKYIDNGLEIRPPSGTNHQQPGSHLSIDTRLSELSIGEVDGYNKVTNGIFYEARSLSASSKNSHRVQVNTPNCYITSPFKQGYQVPRKGPFKVVDPSYELKNVTRESIAKVRQQFRRPKPPIQPSHYTQRLRKARLKTTGRPFSGSGPSIQQCKGIQSGVRVIHSSGQPGSYLNESYSRMGSSTLRPESPTELLRPESSIHCTSRASTKAGSNKESGSDDSFEQCALDSWVKYSNLERNYLLDNGEGHDEHQPRGKDIIDHHKDPGIGNASSSNVQKSKLEIPQDGVVSDVQAPSTEEDDNSISSLEKHFSLEDDDHIPDKELNRQNSKETCDIKKSNEKDQKCTTQKNYSCKPFRDDKNLDDADDDDDDDDQKRFQLLISNYHSNRTSEHQQDLTSSLDQNVQGTNESQSKNSKKQSKACHNSILSDGGSCSSVHQGNLPSSLKDERVSHNSISCNGESCSSVYKSIGNWPHNSKDERASQKTKNVVLNDLIVESSVKSKVLVMTVHVKRKEIKEMTNENENEKDKKNSSQAEKELTNSELEATQFNDMNPDDDDDIQIANDDYDEINSLVDDDDDDDDDLDIDRIPSAEIWKNLDQLNLSMNAHYNRFEPQNNPEFPSKARIVKSAGVQRKPLNLNTNGQYTDAQKNKQQSRLSSAKWRAKKDSKSKPKPIDKAELLRKYLSEESRRFSADLRSKLPGYFTEQFNIIQQGKLGEFSMESVDVQELLEKTLVKCEGEEIKSSCDTERNIEGEFNSTEKKRGTEDVEECEVDQVEEHRDPTSFGVFFTMESTSTCEVESMSERTEETVGENSESRELSDDTGFETMPGNTGLHDNQNSCDNLIDDEKSSFKLSDYKQVQKDFGKQESLEIIAKAKHLTDPSLSSKKPLPSPHEPLKFYINAKPPAGYLYYFAYGVDMNIKRMSIYLRREHKRRWGVLFGFRLRFNKKGTSSDAGGFANVEFSPGSSVEGCVYTLTDAELLMLDNCIGYPKHYTRAVLPVWMCNSYHPSLHGVAQYCVPAVLYVAVQQWIQPDAADALDNNYSVSQCLKGADILTPSYVEYLNQLSTTNSVK